MMIKTVNTPNINNSMMTKFKSIKMPNNPSIYKIINPQITIFNLQVKIKIIMIIFKAMVNVYTQNHI